MSHRRPSQGGLTLTPLAGAFVTPPVGGLPSGQATPVDLPGGAAALALCWNEYGWCFPEGHLLPTRAGPPPAPKAAAGGRLVFPSSITPSVLGGPPPTALAPTSLAPSMGEQRKFLDDGKMRKVCVQ